MSPVKILVGSVGWDCRILRLHLYRGVRSASHQRVSWIWHYTIWRWSFSNDRALENAEYPFIAITPSSTLARSGSTLISCVLVLNWIAWSRTALTFKLHNYAKVNCLKWNCFCMLNRVIWNRTVFYIAAVFRLNWIVWIRTVWLNLIAWNRNLFDN